MRVIGYGICGPGEAKRYMSETLEEFTRLCDKTIILMNGTEDSCRAEIELCQRLRIHWYLDGREWGKMQWKIKEDFVSKIVSAFANKNDVMVCLDMDERFDRHLTKEWLIRMPYDAYKVFIVDLWNDAEHYKPESCFWNTRIWRWTGNTEWIRKPVHCGLAPRWAVAYNRYAPFLLIHKGLMRVGDREKKIARYEKYDPHQIHLAHPYYAMLHSDTAEPFDEEALHATIDTEVQSYKQTKPRTPPLMAQEKGRYAYVINPGGVTIDIPEKQLAETLKRNGFTFVGWADDAEKEMEDMFSSSAEDVIIEDAKKADGDYQESQVELQEGKRDARASAEDLPDIEEEEKEPAPSGVSKLRAAPAAPPRTTVRNRVGMKEAEKKRQTAKTKK